MAQMTIAQLRERALNNYCEKYDKDYSQIKTLMNSYYRLCGLDETLLYRENDERLCNSWYTKEIEAKRDGWYKSLNTRFMAIGLHLVYFGYLPTICFYDEKDVCSGTTTAIERYFYN